MNETATSSTPSPTSAPMVASNDSHIILQTFKVYGSIYLVSFLIFCFLRKSLKFNRLFNIRSWAPEMKAEIAQQEYGWLDWVWKVFQVDDAALLEHCGMDSICFIRVVRFGRYLSYMCCFNAMWLIPLYATAEDSPETSYLTDYFVLISISNLPIQSPRFLGTVLAAYIMFFYAMIMLYREVRWYIRFRHKFLSLKKPRNYAVYVSGIPVQYRSSYDLAQYFRSCSSQDAVFEAHVAMNIPDLESKVARREALVRAIEHTLALERRIGKTKRHHQFDRRGRLTKVETIAALEKDLRSIDEEIMYSTRQILSSNNPLRSKLTRESGTLHLFAKRERKRTGTVDYDYGDEMDDELKRILAPEGKNAWHDLHAQVDAPFDSYIMVEEPSTGRRTLEDHEILEVIDPHPLDSFEMLVTEDLTEYPDETENRDETENQGDPYGSSLVAIDAVSVGGQGHSQSPLNSPPSNGDLEDGDFVTEQAGLGQNLEVPVQTPLLAVPELASIDNQFPVVADVASNVLCNDVLDRMEQGRDDGLSSVSPFPEPVLNGKLTVVDTCGLAANEVCRKVARTVSWSDLAAISSSAEQGANCIELAPNDDNVRHKKKEGARSVDRSQDCCPGQSSGPCSDRSGACGQELSPILELDFTNVVCEPNGNGQVDGADKEGSHFRLKRDDSCSRLSAHSDVSSAKSSKSSVFRNSISSSSRAVLASSLRAGSSLVNAGSCASKAASFTIVQGSRAASQTLVEGSKEVSRTIVKGSQAASTAIKKVTKDASLDKVMESVGETGKKTMKTAQTIGSHVVTSAATVVPMLVREASGSARDAGFVVFSNLFTTQAALQMIHHPKPTTMLVQEAPDPKDIFWRNVGMPHQARRTGLALSVAASAALCIFWSIPTAFISSLTAVNSLRTAIPSLDEFITTHPGAEPFLALIAPLLLLILNEAVLPQILKFFATWEGHISSALLEASLFWKLGCFMIIQTFFVSAISGSILTELGNMLKSPASIVTFLANSLPAQSSYFMQILLTSTFLLQAIELLRIYPLSMAALRRCVGPNLTEKERRRSWGFVKSLEDPPDFWHAETFAQIILYFVILFVYATVAPVTGFFLLFSFLLMESGYRYQYIHNYPPSFETGGYLWRCFVHFTLASMIIGQLTLMGLLVLKQSYYAVPALGPLLAITIIFTTFLNRDSNSVMSNLPTRDCVVLDERFIQEGHSLEFLVGAYLQPALKAELTEPDYNIDQSD